MKMTAKGQITIPPEIRKRAKLRANTEIEFIVAGRQVVIRPAEKRQNRPKVKEPHWVDQMIGKGTINLTTDEIMEMTRGE